MCNIIKQSMCEHRALILIIGEWGCGKLKTRSASSAAEHIGTQNYYYSQAEPPVQRGLFTLSTHQLAIGSFGGLWKQI